MGVRAIAHVICLLCGSAWRADGQLKVLAPKWLKDQVNGGKGNVDGATATFGAPFYGDDVVGRLIYAPSLRGEHHCTADDYEVPAPWDAPWGDAVDAVETGGGRPIDVVVVHRGKCSFVTKVTVAQQKGAHAVVIVDEEDSTLAASQLRRVVVADDGYGDNVHIPSVLISKDDGASLLMAVNKTQVIVRLAWDVPAAEGVVSMDLWMSSGSVESLRFLKEFSPRRKALNKVLAFEPHYVVFRLPHTDAGVYQELCTDTLGELCAQDPDSGGAVTGREVLEEDVRQLCIREKHRASGAALDKSGGPPRAEYSEQYWAYVERLFDQCPLRGDDPAKRFGASCSERLMREAGVDVPAVQACASQTRDEKLRQQRDHTAWSPQALRINGWRYTGVLDADLVTRAICAGFAARPAECEALIKPRDPFEEYAGGIAPDEVSLRTFGLSLFGLLVCCFCGFQRCYKERIKSQVKNSVKEEVMLEVHAQMAAYARLHDEDY